MSVNQGRATDWPAIFRAIDRDITAWTPESLRAAFVEHGCAVVRRAIDLEAIARLRAVTSELYTRTTDVHVFEAEIAEATQGVVSGFDLISNPLLMQFLDRIFAGQRYRRESAAARRVSGAEHRLGWQPPLSLHVDSFFHEFWFTVNFWVPFDECGVAAPGLQLLPIDYRETRRYAGFSRKPIYQPRENAENSQHFPADALNPDRLREDFGEDCLVRPEMKPGDVIIASNWIIHGSYQNPTMANGRTNMEVRFIGTCPDIAVKPDASDRYRIAAWFHANRLATKLRSPTRTGLPFWAERM
jgi:ectoine hydroxylase-related dioxygenase (phytanoyl-CoA dioxygenase family)